MCPDYRGADVHAGYLGIHRLACTGMFTPLFLVWGGAFTGLLEPSIWHIQSNLDYNKPVILSVCNHSQSHVVIAHRAGGMVMMAV